MIKIKKKYKQLKNYQIKNESLLTKIIKGKIKKC
jgi:hypothetical protein